MFQNIATAQVVTSEKYKLNYEELKDRPTTFEEPLNYQTMAGDDIIQSGQEYVSTSESDSISTNGLEQDGVIYVCGNHLLLRATKGEHVYIQVMVQTEL